MTITERIIDLFRRRKRLTDIELQALLGCNPNSVRPCRLNLLRKGMIRKTGIKKHRYEVYEFVDNYKEPRRKARVTKGAIRSLLRKYQQLQKKVVAMIVEYETLIARQRKS